MPGLVMELIALMRPQQWPKNAFVLVGPLFGHAWTDPQLMARGLWAFVAFCLVSSGAYVLNDMADRKADRLHPKKRARPLAAGTLPMAAAAGLAASLITGSVAVALQSSGKVAVLVGSYVLLNLTYSFWLKHKVLVDVFLIATGFMLRILAGTVGIGIEPSHWLLLCGLMVTLFLGFTKRRAELAGLNGEGVEQRAVLIHYSPVLLDEMIGITAACVIMSYSLYTMSPETIATHGTSDLIYTVPFVVYGVFRYVYLLHQQHGGTDAVHDLARDPYLTLSVVAWMATTLWVIA